MRISYKWLREYIDLTISAQELKDKLTFSGIEVEHLHTTGEITSQIVVGEILSKDLHPDADKLSVCSVYDGTHTHQVVCGAPNCATGQKVAFAPIGTKFPDFQIKKAKIRGVESCGMICSEQEMGLSQNHDGIMILPADAPVGVAISEYLSVSDTIYEVEITPNRPDLLGMIGIARDLSAQLDIPLTIPEVTPLHSIEAQSDFQIENLEPELCTRYTATRISGVLIAPSPQWLVDKLKIADIKPINNIVDITNYVMYVYGHPLHAFDERQVEGDKIVIRKSQNQEKFEALDHQVYTLSGQELVIADSIKPIALAGVIGGKNSLITDDTTDIILEAACFDYAITRSTSHSLKIYTDSSYRFERGMAEVTCEIVAKVASEMILQIAGGVMVGDPSTPSSKREVMLDHYPIKKEKRVISLRPARVKKVLALTLDNHQIITYLRNLGLQFIRADAESLHFEIPQVRKDLTREIDLIEEIIRLRGYDSLPELPETSDFMDQGYFYAKREIKSILVNAGFFEAINLSFTDPAMLDLLQLPEDDYRRKTVKIMNPQGSSFSIMRSHLLPQLLKNLRLNLFHGASDIRLFEMNKVFLDVDRKFPAESWRLTGVMTGKQSPIFWKEKSANIDYYDVKGVIDKIFDYLSIRNVEIFPSSDPFLLPNHRYSLAKRAHHLPEFFDLPISEGEQGLQIGVMGRVDKKLLNSFDIDCDVYMFDFDIDHLFRYADFDLKPYREVAKYPAVYRDLSFVISKQYHVKNIIETIKETNPKIIKSITPFDEFTGKQIPDGFRSLSISISLYSETKTLTDEQIKTILARVVERLSDKYKIEMR